MADGDFARAERCAREAAVLDAWWRVMDAWREDRYDDADWDDDRVREALGAMEVFGAVRREARECARDIWSAVAVSAAST